MSYVSINDFKLLNIKCQKYFDLFSKTNNFAQPVNDTKLQQRIGFYLFMLKSLCNEKDIDIISDFITCNGSQSKTVGLAISANFGSH